MPVAENTIEILDELINVNGELTLLVDGLSVNGLNL